MIILGICGIVAEFNPLHNGHKYLIERAKFDGNTVIAVISGNFVQRGDTAIIPKFRRAEMALACGVDVVVELPTPWAMSTAQNFAFGAISQLVAFGIDSLYFGSESENCDELRRVADILLSDEFNAKISSVSSNGKTFAKLRSELVNEILGYESSVLNSPNDTLAVEYICAAKRLGTNLRFVPIKRIGTGHNDLSSDGEFSNATIIREKILYGDNDALKYVPVVCKDILLSSPVSNISKLDNSIITCLKLKNKNEFANLPDISEGIDNLLYNKIRTSVDYQELLSSVKSKRYTLARIRRLILSAFLDIDSRYFGKQPPYVRVLGFKKDSFDFKMCQNKPIITKISQVQHLDEESKALFEKENQINEIYALSLDIPNAFKNECTEKIIIK